MAKATKKVSDKSQAQRFLEAAKAKAVGADQSGGKFSQAMGKITMAKRSRKATKMG